MKLKEYYNKKELIKEFIRRTHCYISYVGFADFERKGMVSRVGFYRNGKQIRPLYDEESLRDFIVKIEELREEGKLKLRLA